jgi:hypothetical protein
MTEAYISEQQPDRMTYRLSGNLTEAVARALCDEVTAQPATAPVVVVDLRELSGYEPASREILVAAHRHWAQGARRVGYLARKPLFRGLSLWVMHRAGDDRAKAVGTESQLEDWLGDGRTRMQQYWDTLGEAAPPAWRLGHNLTRTERAASRGLEWFMRLAVMEPPGWLSEVIRLYGLRGYRQFFTYIEAARDELCRHCGPLSTEALISLTAMWNGCRYCSRGHLLGANLLHLRDTGRLFPLPEDRIFIWQGMNDDDARADIDARLAGEPDLASLRAHVARLFALKSGVQAPESEAGEPMRAALVRLDSAWSLLNECSIVDNGVQVPPLHPDVWSDKELLRRYRDARASQPSQL